MSESLRAVDKEAAIPKLFLRQNRAIPGLNAPRTSCHPRETEREHSIILPVNSRNLLLSEETENSSFIWSIPGPLNHVPPSA